MDLQDLKSIRNLCYVSCINLGQSDNESGTGAYTLQVTYLT